MINYIQSNQDVIQNINVLHDNVWDNMTKYIQKKNTANSIYNKFLNIQNKYSIETRSLIRNYLNYLIFKRIDLIHSDFLLFAESVMHNYNASSNYLLRYVVTRLKELL